MNLREYSGPNIPGYNSNPNNPNNPNNNNNANNSNSTNLNSLLNGYEDQLYLGSPNNINNFNNNINMNSNNSMQSSYEFMDKRLKENNNPMMIRTFSDPRLNISMIPSPSPGSPLPKRPEATFVMDISPSVVGWIIGRSGIRIKEIQAQTGCKMWVDQDVPNDQPRKIYFHGNKANIDAAVSRVSELVQSAPILASASVTSGKGLTSTIVDCPVSLVGLLIGKRGWTIKKIQQASGAQISINQSVREGLPRKIIVSGDENSVATALHLIDEVLRDKSGLSQELDSPYDISPGGNNGLYLGGLDNYGRLDSPIYDPRLLSPQGGVGGVAVAVGGGGGGGGAGGVGANMMYRQQFQTMAGTPPPMMQNSPNSLSIGRFPSPNIRNIDEFRPRMPGTASYEGSMLQQLNQYEQMMGYEGGHLENQNPGNNLDPSFNRQMLYSDDQNNPSTNILMEDLLRKNNERGADIDRWNPQSLSAPGTPLVDSMLELNMNPSQTTTQLDNNSFANAGANANGNGNNNANANNSNNNANPAARLSREGDGSLLSYHLRQQHQKSLQQAQLNPQQGNVFPLTQGKMVYRGNIVPSTLLSSEYSQQQQQQQQQQFKIPSSPIDTSQRSLSDSSTSVYRSSQSNSYHSSPLSESPLNAGPYIFGISPNDSLRAMPSGNYLPHPGIAMDFNSHNNSNNINNNMNNSSRSRVSSSSSSSETYLDQHGQIARSFPLNNSDLFSVNGMNLNQIDDSNPLGQLHLSNVDYNSSTLQTKDQMRSRSLPNSTFEISPESRDLISQSKQPLQQQQPQPPPQQQLPLQQQPQISPSFGIPSEPYDFRSGSQNLSLYSPLYPEHSPSNYSDSGLHAPSTSPQRNDSIYDELYGFSNPHFLGLSADDTKTLEAGLSSLLGNNNPEVETLSTSLGSVGSVGSVGSIGSVGSGSLSGFGN